LKNCSMEVSSNESKLSDDGRFSSQERFQHSYMKS
jgi:hypothetical protein